MASGSHPFKPNSMELQRSPTEQEGFEPPLPERVKRFSRPSPENSNCDKNKDLQSQANGAYKPAYKENPKTAENRPQNLPDDLAQIVSVWPDLPEHIKAAIKVLVQGYAKESD